MDKNEFYKKNGYWPSEEVMDEPKEKETDIKKTKKKERGKYK